MTAVGENAADYESLRLVLFQEFFDTFTSDFLAEAVQRMPLLKFDDIEPEWPLFNDSDLIKIDFNLTDIAIYNTSLDGSKPIIKLDTDKAKF